MCVCVYVCVHISIYTYTYHETRAEVASHRRALAGAVAAICTNSLAFVNLAVAVAGVAGVLSGRAEM